METYYQQVGRAGRDGEPSECIMFWSPTDMGRLRYLVEQSSKALVKEEKQNAELTRQLLTASSEDDDEETRRVLNWSAVLHSINVIDDDDATLDSVVQVR